MYIGLDFGTTNSSAAVYDGQTITTFPLESDTTGEASSILPSTLFIPGPSRYSRIQPKPLVGRAAMSEFIRRNQGRVIQYQKKHIASNAVTYADGVVHYNDFYVNLDSNPPGRLFKSLKTELRDPSYIGTDVFGDRYTLPELIAIILQSVRAKVEQNIGQQVTGFVVGCPVRYAADDYEDWLAFERMKQACVKAQLPDVTFLEEPVAATLSYVLNAKTKQNVLLFDFGGGTLDITIIAMDGFSNLGVLSTQGLTIGGDLLDQKIMMGKLLSHFGEGTTYDGRAFPAHILENLASLESMMELLQPRYQSLLDEMYNRTESKKELRALRALVNKNYGLAIYNTVERAKVSLSSHEEVLFRARLGNDPDNLDINFEERISRIDFDRLIKPYIRAAEQCIDETLQTAGVTEADIDVVLRTGGSSRVPAFVNMLATKFGEAKLQEMDVFSSVAAGLAIAAWHRSQTGRVIRECRADHEMQKDRRRNSKASANELQSVSDASNARRTITTRGPLKQTDGRNDSIKEGLQQSFHDSRDGSKGLGHMRREYDGRFGSYPMHDDYGDESSPD